MEPNTVPSKLAVAKDAVALFESICQKHGFSKAQAALLFSRGHQGIAQVVIGVETMWQLEEIINNCQVEADFSFCRQELRKSFRNLPEQLIKPYLWNKV